ncbi:MAG: hypothetical protein JSW40_08135 [Candidatus Omnitrophota bacterium]|nr:MAG: hypothetical protein JSW40_08135 [Candidatus Omnitrophota bacterium]
MNRTLKCSAISLIIIIGVIVPLDIYIYFKSGEQIAGFKLFKCGIYFAAMILHVVMYSGFKIIGQGYHNNLLRILSLCLIGYSTGYFGLRIIWTFFPASNTLDFWCMRQLHWSILEILFGYSLLKLGSTTEIGAIGIIVGVLNIGGGLNELALMLMMKYLKPFALFAAFIDTALRMAIGISGVILLFKVAMMERFKIKKAQEVIPGMQV